jgi:hypothetical protein
MMRSEQPTSDTAGIVLFRTGTGPITVNVDRP